MPLNTVVSRFYQDFIVSKQPSQKNNKRVKANSSEGEPMSMRSKLGWMTLVMIALLVYGILRYKTIGDASFFELNRTAVIMVLLWLAWSDLEALPRWLLYLVPICVGVCAWRPQYILVVAPLAFLFLMLRPPARKRNRTKR